MPGHVVIPTQYLFHSRTSVFVTPFLFCLPFMVRGSSSSASRVGAANLPRVFQLFDPEFYACGCDALSTQARFVAVNTCVDVKPGQFYIDVLLRIVVTKLNNNVFSKSKQQQQQQQQQAAHVSSSRATRSFEALGNKQNKRTILHVSATPGEIQSPHSLFGSSNRKNPLLK